jgi:hypothetical protein
MINFDESTFVHVEACDALRSGLEKLISQSGASALTRDELCEVSALRIRIWVAQLNAARRQFSGAFPVEYQSA